MKYKNPLHLLTVTSDTGWDEKANSSISRLILSVDRGTHFEDKTLSKKDWSAFKTLSFRKGTKHYATKHR